MDSPTLALHVLRALAAAQREGQKLDLAALARAIRVRRPDVRRVLSALHREGYVDVLHMRPTLAGFALGAALASAELPPLRAPSPAARAHAA